jgi:ribosomal protein S18 acetylase RimI-like enzyme
MADRRLTVDPAVLQLRPATADDRDFLLAVYASTRADELSVVSWTDAGKAAFVAMQFDAQDAYYRQVYPDAQFLVVIRDGEAVGRLSLARLEDEIRIIDLALLPQDRGLGTGSRLLADVMAEADASGLAVRLHVEPWNPAMRLYERLGFRSVAEQGPYLRMERSPRSAAGSVEHGLVHQPSIGVRTDRDEEDLELAEHRV